MKKILRIAPILLAAAFLVCLLLFGTFFVLTQKSVRNFLNDLTAVELDEALRLINSCQVVGGSFGHSKTYFELKNGKGIHLKKKDMYKKETSEAVSRVYKNCGYHLTIPVE